MDRDIRSIVLEAVECGKRDQDFKHDCADDVQVMEVDMISIDLMECVRCRCTSTSSWLHGRLGDTRR